MKNICVIFCFIFVNCCWCQKSPTYKAAVVELNPHSSGDTWESVNAVLNQTISILSSAEISAAEIIVLPEAIFNRQNTAIPLPNSNLTLCDEPSAHFVLRNISCVARTIRKYIVIDLYIKVQCSLDDQTFCSNQTDSTNMYNMAIVFDRRGDIIAKYRKYHLFNEVGVQETAKPDMVTFRTDFNVTFGICICFDLMFDEPVVSLKDRGITNFVYPTMWFSEIPYLSAVQYQQSWAVANNVNLLAANVNSPSLGCSGSGIYAGRLGALEVFVSEVPTTKIMLADVPIELPIVQRNGDVLYDTHLPSSVGETAILGSFDQPTVFTNNSGNLEYKVEPNDDLSEIRLMQDDLSEFSVQFLNLSKNIKQVGTVCNKAICCNYTIEASENAFTDGMQFYSYAISVFSGVRHYKSIKGLGTGQDVCSLIACTEMNAKDSCGIRLLQSRVQPRYNITKLTLETILPVTYMKVMPNTLTGDLMPLHANEFDYKISEDKAGKYWVRLNLEKPNSNLLTFAIFSRDFSRDVNTGSMPRGESILFILCLISSFIWLRSNQ